MGTKILYVRHLLLPTSTSKKEICRSCYPGADGATRRYEFKVNLDKAKDHWFMADRPPGFADRLGKAFERALPKLGPEAQRQLRQIITPESLAIVAGVVALWIAGHAFGVCELVDIILAVVGWFSIGFAVFSGLDELFLFARQTYSATGDLEQASNHLAKAIDILGIQAVLAVLFRNRPRADIGQIEGKPRAKATFEVEKAPARTPGTAYKPTITADPSIPAGSGETSWSGDITVSTRGNSTDQALVLLLSVCINS